MPIAPESLLTDDAFVERVEQALRFTALGIATEARTTEHYEARQLLAAALADNAEATREYANKFSRLLIGDTTIENQCTTATTQADITRVAIRSTVAAVWNLFAVRLLKGSR